MNNSIAFWFAMIGAMLWIGGVMIIAYYDSRSGNGYLNTADTGDLYNRVHMEPWYVPGFFMGCFTSYIGGLFGLLAFVTAQILLGTW